MPTDLPDPPKDTAERPAGISPFDWAVAHALAAVDEAKAEGVDDADELIGTFTWQLMERGFVIVEKVSADALRSQQRPPTDKALTEERGRLAKWCHSEAASCYARARQKSSTGKATWQERGDTFESIARIVRGDSLGHLEPPKEGA